MKDKREKALFALHRFTAAYKSGSHEVFQNFINNPDFEKETLQPLKDYLGWTSLDEAAAEEMKKGIQGVTRGQPVGKSGSASRMFFKLAGTAALAGGIYYAIKNRQKETAEK